MDISFETEAEYIFFISSSGHCNLECAYCIINPIAKRLPSITNEDMDFLFKSISYAKSFLCFSGQGDFFAGYRKEDQFLKHVLSYDVEVALDVNGVLIREFDTLPASSVAKIRFMNITFHYNQIKRRKLLEKWADNVLCLLSKTSCDVLMGYVVSPLHENEWIEALEFYESLVFARFPKKLVLIRDILHPLNSDQEQKLQFITRKFNYLVDRVHKEDFARLFKGIKRVLCPAGCRYFRVWNDGRIVGCPNVPDISALTKLGNVKERTFNMRQSYVDCYEPFYCDCAIIKGLGKMKYFGLAVDL